MKILLVIITLIAALGLTTGFAQNDQDSYDPDERRAWVEEVERQDFHFWRRFLLTKRSGIDRGNEWFIPSELVAGGFSPFFPTAKDGERTIGADALETASEYAFERNSQAFYVLHKGKVQYSKFADGAYDESIISARSFAKTVVSFLLGIALADNDIVRRQHSWDRLRELRKGEFLAHRHTRGVDDERQNSAPSRSCGTYSQGYSPLDAQTLFS